MALTKNPLIFETIRMLGIPIRRAKTIVPRQANRAVMAHRFAILLPQRIDVIVTAYGRNRRLGR
jgi:hypothetical protein